MLTTTSFGKANSWVIPNSEWRTQFWIDYEETYYSTYVDFDTMTWAETLW